jgi:hypothetical protein
METPKEATKSKPTKIVVKNISEVEINYEALKFEKAPEPIRKSWVPQLGGVTATFDF